MCIEHISFDFLLLIIHLKLILEVFLFRKMLNSLAFACMLYKSKSRNSVYYETWSLIKKYKFFLFVLCLLFHNQSKINFVYHNK